MWWICVIEKISPTYLIIASKWKEKKNINVYIYWQWIWKYGIENLILIYKGNYFLYINIFGKKKKKNDYVKFQIVPYTVHKLVQVSVLIWLHLGLPHGQP